MADEEGYGQQGPADGASKYNNIEFIVQQILGRISTMKLVQVKKVTNAGEVSAVGFVDVQPMVSLIDGNNNATPHGTIYNVPYIRIQGGKSAIIMDPKVDDIGWAGICDRDISAVKTAKAVSPPGSFRKFDLADAVYLGGLLNGVPENYVQFTDDDKINIVAKSDVSVTTEGKAKITATSDVEIVSSGGNVNITAPTQIHLTAATIKFSGAIVFDGNASAVGGTFNFTGNINQTGNYLSSGTMQASVITNGTVSLATHHHVGPVVAGSVTTGGALP